MALRHRGATYIQTDNADPDEMYWYLTTYRTDNPVRYYEVKPSVHAVLELLHHMLENRWVDKSSFWRRWNRPWRLFYTWVTSVKSRMRCRFALAWQSVSGDGLRSTPVTLALAETVISFV